MTGGAAHGRARRGRAASFLAPTTGAAEMDGAELDVAKTPAFAVLDELFKSGKVTETKCVPAPVSRRIRRSEPVAVDARAGCRTTRASTSTSTRPC